MDTSLYEKLLASAFRFVSYRPRSEKEVRDFLTKKLIRWGVAGKASVTKTMDRLKELGYVDDRKFAAWWISQRSTFRPKGARALKSELIRKGIAREVIDEEPFNEKEAAKKAIQKKLVLWASLPIIEQKKKMYTFLAQRGFSSETIEAIMSRLRYIGNTSEVE